MVSEIETNLLQLCVVLFRRKNYPLEVMSVASGAHVIGFIFTELIALGIIEKYELDANQNLKFEIFSSRRNI